MQRALIIGGIALIAVGLAWPWLQKLGLGRLPGDIAYEKDGLRIYIPLATSLLASAALSLIVWLLNKR